MDINSFFTWVMTSAGASALMSFIAEQIPAFKAMSSKAKWWAMLLGSVVLALISWACMTYIPAETLKQLDAPFKMVAAIVISYLANQAFHTLDPNRKA
jgi:uncharacterized membrane protein YfcA